MTDLSWLNFVPIAAFAFTVESKTRARILFWNDAMEEHADVTGDQARGGALSAMSQRLTRAVHHKIKSANLGSLGTFKLKVLPDGIVIAVYGAGDTAAAEDEKVMFLAMAAHDLRAPLRQIISIVDEVRDGFQDMGNGKLELLNMIDDVGERARAFTDDVITYTRATQIHLDKMGEMNIRPFAQNIFLSVDREQKHVLRCDDVFVDTDQIALQIALRNLFDNAIRHGGKSQMMIEMTVSEVAQSGLVRFTISDNGKGLAFPADFFEMSMVNRSSSSFGLLGVQRLIEGRRGTISARRPESGTGSTITFTLPGVLVPLDQGDAEVDQDVSS